MTKTLDQVKKECRYHHTSTVRGYISRKCKEGIVSEYKGRFGEGYIVRTPRWDTTQYHYVTYYVR